MYRLKGFAAVRITKQELLRALNEALTSHGSFDQLKIVNVWRHRNGDITLIFDKPAQAEEKN